MPALQTELFAGIDGGQSATTAVVAYGDGRIAGRACAGAADEVGEGAGSTRLRDALQGALAGALRAAGLDERTPLRAVVAGISGYDCGRIYGRAPEFAAAQTLLLHDAPIAHAGAFAGGPGVVVIAGTGSVAYARDESGAEATVGGWGYLFGDEGSAFWVVRETLCEAMHAQDAASPMALAPAACSFFGVPSLRELARSFYAGQISRERLAAFAPAIVSAAECGDEAAAQILCRGARALVQLAIHAAARLKAPAPRVAFVGGMLRDQSVRETVGQAMRELAPHFEHVAPRYEPALGALLLAFRLAGLAPPALVGA